MAVRKCACCGKMMILCEGCEQSLFGSQDPAQPKKRGRKPKFRNTAKEDFAEEAEE